MGVPRVQVGKSHRRTAKKKPIPAPGDDKRKKENVEVRKEAAAIAAANRERSAAIRAATRILVEIRKDGKWTTHEDRMAELRRRSRSVYRAYIEATKPKRKER